MNEFKYVGSELDLFSAVHNWKSYWSSRIRPFVAGDVLEVGAGIGANTPISRSGEIGAGSVLSPMRISLLNCRESSQGPDRQYEIVCGTLQNLAVKLLTRFSTSISNTSSMTAVNWRRRALLRRGGDSLSIARPSALSPRSMPPSGIFDAITAPCFATFLRPAFGLSNLVFGFCRSSTLSANRLFLRQSMPTKAQLRFWDQWVVPVSRVLDRSLFGLVGKSIVGIWCQEKE